MRGEQPPQPCPSGWVLPCLVPPLEGCCWDQLSHWRWKERPLLAPASLG